MTAAGPPFHFHRATPAGEGGMAVFDLYGEGAADALRRVFRPRGGALPGEGRVRLGDLQDLGGNIVDEAMVSNVPAKGSWSRLASWSVAVHGSPWIEKRTAELLEALGGGALDLSGVLRMSIGVGAIDAVEAAASQLLVEARTEKAARFFARQRGGELSRRLREALALASGGKVGEARDLLRSLLAFSRQALCLGRPLRVLIAGRPNSGKSTLFNRLAEDERAAVTPVAGTTRDLLEELIAVEDYPVVVTDSAGLRPLDAVGAVEREGILRVHGRTDDAVIYLLPCPWQWTREDREFLDRWPSGRVLIAASLADLRPGAGIPPEALRLSALTGAGLAELRRDLVRRWIDSSGAPVRDVPCAAFTEAQVEILSLALDAAQGSEAPALDAIRTATIECLTFSWP